MTQTRASTPMFCRKSAKRALLYQKASCVFCQFDCFNRANNLLLWGVQEIHSKINRHVKNRLQSLSTGKGIDFATAEALAFGSMMLEGNDVRISGQDVGRGTFSHRHAMLVDQQTEGVIVPLNDVLQAPGKLELANSA